MDLFFGSYTGHNRESRPYNLVTFTIPDIGVKFKAPFRAENMALDYVSLLALLEFVDINPQLFANRALELYCNNYDLVRQINSNMVDEEELEPLLHKALEYRSKMNFSINWVSRPDNPAQNLEID